MVLHEKKIVGIPVAKREDVCMMISRVSWVQRAGH